MKYENHGGAMPILFILLILSILSEKRPNAWRRNERFANRNYEIMAVNGMMKYEV
jgi:hypothetical protein